MAKRAFTWFERLSERVYNSVYASAERRASYTPPAYPGGLGMMPVDYHAIVPTCALVTGPGAPEHLAADRAILRARAARSRRERPARTVTLFLVAASLFPLAAMVYGSARSIAGADRGPDVGDIVFLVIALLFGVAMTGYFVALSLGRHVCLVHAMQEWSERLGGDSALDTVEPVVAWIEHYWPWLSPPHFLAKESVWATGRIHGYPALLISERDDRWMISSARDALAVSLAAGHAADMQAPPSILCRFSLFVSGALLRKDASAQAVIDELGFLGYGVVTCPAGVYIYGLSYERSLQPRHLGPMVDKAITMMSRPAASTARGAQEG